MNTFNIIETLRNAYECSTQKNNLFEKAVKSIKWEYSFYVDEDEEYYYEMDDFTLVVTSLDPFNMERKPSLVFTDGSIIYF